jgi:hypothetical protein
MARMKCENGDWYLSNDWSIDDVRSVLDCESGFTDDDCVRVLEVVVEAFDANLGINWDVIGAAVDMVVGEKKGVKK